MADERKDTRRQTTSGVESTVIDNPCWGSKNLCSLSHLLGLIDRNTSIILESEDYIVLNKPPDLRMDGDYPATVIKLLTYWYPSHSLQIATDLMQKICNLTKLNDLHDNEIRPCHQLDYATSGALLVGRTREAARKACESFRDRTSDKTYLALVHGHVDIDCPTLSISSEQIVDWIRCFDKERANKSKVNRKQTFKGFQPTSSIFLKWKNFRAREGGKRPRDFDMVCNVEKKILKKDLDSLALMSWGQIKKNEQWKSAFDDVAKAYNESLKEEQNNHKGVESTKSLELATVFRLKEDNDKNIFYVNASLATKADEFSMEIHPDACKKNNGTTNDKCAKLDFKLAVTRCKIIRHAVLRCGTKTTKMQLQPLTGRRHQLRCHMVVVSAPIIGDATYSMDHKRNHMVKRMCLHAYSLRLPDNIDVKTSDPFVLEGTEVSINLV